MGIAYSVREVGVVCNALDVSSTLQALEGYTTGNATDF